ncbi:MAG TPA: sigma-70 family RNA polymerase sigma factor [Bryobacteraceae bacterium]|jgi:RNA polymerase sigma factor (TIGR02999 family)|nr:sigma-70 family RNA polymerase sigma factor [Bryobacteraceae bacterium]
MDTDSPDAHQVTRLLHAWRSGETDAREQLITLVYPQLRSLAARYMSGEAGGHTLSATSLVHEAYIKILGSSVDWDDRVHFFAVAARIMRHLLVDHAKSKRRAKRGGPAAKISLDDVVVVSAEPEDQIVFLNEALEDLAAIDSRKAEIVELVYFGGLSQLEAASALGISEATIQRELRLARSWLYRALSRAGEES